MTCFTAATCKDAKKIIQEKYNKLGQSKMKKVNELNQKASRLVQDYINQRDEVSNMEAELSNWQSQLTEHERKYKELSKHKEHHDFSSTQNQLTKCEENLKDCKEKIKTLEKDISEGKIGLQDIVDAITDCEIQLKVAIDELSVCEEMLRKNRGSMDQERDRKLQEKAKERTAEKVFKGGVGSYFVGVGLAAISPFTG